VETRKQKTVIIFKKNRRHNYRRRNGHRQILSTVRITDILLGGAKPAKKAAAKPAAKPATKAEAAPKAAAAPAADGFKDDVKLISGVGPALEKKLAAAGVTSLKQIAEFTPADVERVDAELSFKGRIEREEWIDQ